MPKWLRNLQWMLSNWRWYRRWYGGRWERWWVDCPVCSMCWHTGNLQRYDGRPSPLCRGTPVVEEWPGGPHEDSPVDCSGNVQCLVRG